MTLKALVCPNSATCADLLAASRDDNTIRWFEQLGTRTFAEHIIATDAISAQDVFGIDLDQVGWLMNVNV